MRLSGRLRSSLIIGGQGIRARKMRTFLSMISLFLGVLAVVVVQAGAQIAEHSLLANEELTSGKDGTMVMYVPSHAGTVSATLDTLRGRTDAVASTSTSAIIGEPGVTPVNPGGGPFDGSGGFGPCDGMGNCYGAGDQKNDQAAPPTGAAIELEIVGLTGDIRQFRPFRPVSGEWLDFRSGPALSPRIVINKQAAK